MEETMICEEKQNTGTNSQRYGSNFLFCGQYEYFCVNAALISRLFLKDL
jgi:hypothetical protein